MENNSNSSNKETKSTTTKAATTKTVAKPVVVAKPTTLKSTTVAKPVASKPTAKKPVVSAKPTPIVQKAAVVVEKVVAEVKSSVENKVEVKVEKAKTKSTFTKVIEASKATNKIVQMAGMQILGSSIETTKAIADIYKKAGKKAVYLGKELIDDTTKLGKELMNDTTKIVAKNQKTVKETSMKAFKETVDTIKDTNLIENPLKGILKNKKK
jgi:hypothetical protein